MVNPTPAGETPVRRAGRFVAPRPGSIANHEKEAAKSLKNDDERPDAEGLRRRAERAIAQGAAPAAGSDPASLLHELQVHQLELEMQNESLRQSQAETEAARQRLERPSMRTSRNGCSPAPPS